jgi:hypothetical protein
VRSCASDGSSPTQGAQDASRRPKGGGEAYEVSLTSASQLELLTTPLARLIWSPSGSTRQIWRRATRPSWSPASSHPRCRAGLEALRAASTGHAPAAGRRTRSPVAYIIGWHTRTPEQADLPAAAPACSLVVCLIRWPDRRCRQPLG